MKVAIVGAGLCGLLTAQRLQKLGHEVSVFEKARGSGGRMASLRKHWGQIDMGAQFFTATDTNFTAVVNDWQAKGWCQKWSFTPYQQCGPDLNERPDEHVRYIGISGMSAITRGLAQSVNANFQSLVRSVERINGVWQLHGSNGQYLGAFDWLICSQPSEQSRLLLQGKSYIADNLPNNIHRPCWALALATRGTAKVGIDGIFAEGELSWVSRLSSRPGVQPLPEADDLWLMHFNPITSHELGANVDPIDLVNKGKSWLRNFLGETIEVTHHHSHFWRYAELANGDHQTGALIDHKSSLACIGSWTAGGGVEGAFLSSEHLIGEMC